MINFPFKKIKAIISNDSAFNYSHYYHGNDISLTNELLAHISMVMFNIKESGDIKILKDGDVSFIDSGYLNKFSSNAYLISIILFRGKTIVFNHLEKKHESLYLLFDYFINIESKLTHFNLYWSPPGSIGSGAHKDNHDVIILQLSGSKKWIIENRDILLSPGDILYIKKGTYHNPITTSESDSIHLTIGVKTDNLSYKHFPKEDTLHYESLKENNLTIINTIKNTLNDSEIYISIPRKTTNLKENQDIVIKNDESEILISKETSNYLFEEKLLQKDNLILRFKKNLSQQHKENIILSLIRDDLPFSVKKTNKNKNSEGK